MHIPRKSFFLAALLTVGSAAVTVYAPRSGNLSANPSAYGGGDTTEPTAQGKLLSAFYGVDNLLPPITNFLICQNAAGMDGLPVVFSEELAQLPNPEDFRVTAADGSRAPVACTTFDPADDNGEQRTVLLVGEFGSAEQQPAEVEIIGDVLSIDQDVGFKGARAPVTPLEEGPSIVLAQSVRVTDWDLFRIATPIPWGGGSACPRDGLQQIVRVTWDGGVVLANGNEIGDAQLDLYQVTLQRPNGTHITVSPFAFGDLNDGDNNHELCLADRGKPVMVSFPAGQLIDPNGDLNNETRLLISAP